MEFRALLPLTLLLFVEPGFGQRGDADIDGVELIKFLNEKLKLVERLQNAVDALEVTGLKSRLISTEEEIDKLKQNSAIGAPRIAFSASLANFGEIYKGPCTDKVLIYKRVFSNTGDGYDQSTGIFTAPVGGLYFFSFSTYGYNTHAMGALLMKNGVSQISTYDGPTSDGSDSSSNAVALQLAAGDVVHMQLWDNGRVYDNLNGHTTFSGFLVFPV
ncbi:cerebellin 11 [Pungitius pungitius]|uniref:cerebellin 11 n=1 Tax=Pungitius pungitius TaxID=134920 RepID=UPI002E0F8D95